MSHDRYAHKSFHHGRRRGRKGGGDQSEERLLCCWASMACYVWQQGNETAADRSRALQARLLSTGAVPQQVEQEGDDVAIP